MSVNLVFVHAGLGLALLALLAGVYAAVGPRGDISIRSDCRGTALSAYSAPQAENPPLEAAGFVDPARLCNENAVDRARAAFILLIISLALGGNSARLTRCRVPRRGVP